MVQREINNSNMKLYINDERTEELKGLKYKYIYE